MKLFNHSSINSYMLSNFHHWELAMCEEKAGLEEKIKGECMLCSLHWRIQLLPLVLGDDRSRISQKRSVWWRPFKSLHLGLALSFKDCGGPDRSLDFSKLHLKDGYGTVSWNQLLVKTGRGEKRPPTLNNYQSWGRARYTVKCERQVRNREDVLFAN